MSISRYISQVYACERVRAEDTYGSRDCGKWMHWKIRRGWFVGMTSRGATSSFEHAVKGCVVRGSKYIRLGRGGHLEVWIVRRGTSLYCRQRVRKLCSGRKNQSSVGIERCFIIVHFVGFTLLHRRQCDHLLVLLISIHTQSTTTAIPPFRRGWRLGRSMRIERTTRDIGYIWRTIWYRNFSSPISMRMTSSLWWEIVLMGGRGGEI